MKKNKLMSILVLAATLSAQANLAHAEDLTGDKTDLIIQVTKSGSMRKFELCSKSKGPSSCRILGRKGWYSMSELQDQRTTEELQAGASVVAGIAVVAVTIATGGIAGLALGGSYTLAGGVLVGTTAAGTGGFLASGWSPIEQFKQQYLLRDSFINDDTIILESADDSKILAVARRLAGLLNKID